MSVPSSSSRFPVTGGGICVAVACRDVQTAITAVEPVADLIDVVEIRLDAMAEVHIETLGRNISCPLLLTNRPEWEGGASNGRGRRVSACIFWFGSGK